MNSPIPSLDYLAALGLFAWAISRAFAEPSPRPAPARLTPVEPEAKIRRLQ